jgi:hypothetical protein
MKDIFSRAGWLAGTGVAVNTNAVRHGQFARRFPGGRIRTSRRRSRRQAGGAGMAAVEIEGEQPAAQGLADAVSLNTHRIALICRRAKFDPGIRT